MFVGWFCIAGHAAAFEAARTDAAKRVCAANCRKTHEASIAAADAEIKNARAANDARRQAAERNLARAQAALATVPVKQSASSAADLLGLTAIVG